MKHFYCGLEIMIIKKLDGQITACWLNSDPDKELNLFVFPETSEFYHVVRDKDEAQKTGV